MLIHAGTEVSRGPRTGPAAQISIPPAPAGRGSYFLMIPAVCGGGHRSMGRTHSRARRAIGSGLRPRESEGREEGTSRTPAGPVSFLPPAPRTSPPSIFPPLPPPSGGMRGHLHGMRRGADSPAGSRVGRRARAPEGGTKEGWREGAGERRGETLGPYGMTFTLEIRATPRRSLTYDTSASSDLPG
jgi:hypothetical protein